MASGISVILGSPFFAFTLSSKEPGPFIIPHPAFPPLEIVLLGTSNSTYIEPFGAYLPNALISAGLAT